MPYAMKPIEQLSINTIRTLSMDAVQAANSGHPGTPMALAPVAYVLFDEVLRYDPAEPHWPNRDRFVLSCGHASMLLYSMLHLAGVKQGRPGQARTSRPCRSTTSATSASLAAAARAIRSTATPAASRRPPARWARASATAWAWRSPRAGWPPVQPARLRPVRLQRLRPVQRRRHDGRHRRRGGLAGRPPQALEPLLDLRRQQDHDRGRDLAGLQRGRGHAVRRLRLERAEGGRRQRPGRPARATWLRSSGRRTGRR